MSLFLDLLKGRSQKYIKRIPKAGGGYRYVYKEHHQGGVGAQEHMKEGAAFKLTFGGQEGHFHIIQAQGDKITVKHDELHGPDHKGVEMTKAELSELLTREHKPALEADAKKKRERVERMKRETPRHIGLKRAERLAKEAEARLGEERKPQRAEGYGTDESGQSNYERHGGLLDQAAERAGIPVSRNNVGRSVDGRIVRDSAPQVSIDSPAGIRRIFKDITRAQVQFIQNRAIEWLAANSGDNPAEIREHIEHIAEINQANAAQKYKDAAAALSEVVGFTKNNRGRVDEQQGTIKALEIIAEARKIGKQAPAPTPTPTPAPDNFETMPESKRSASGQIWNEISDRYPETSIVHKKYVTLRGTDFGDFETLVAEYKAQNPRDPDPAQSVRTLIRIYIQAAPEIIEPIEKHPTAPESLKRQIVEEIHEAYRISTRAKLLGYTEPYSWLKEGSNKLPEQDRLARLKLLEEATDGGAMSREFTARIKELRAQLDDPRNLAPDQIKRDLEPKTSAELARVFEAELKRAGFKGVKTWIKNEGTPREIARIYVQGEQRGRRGEGYIDLPMSADALPSGSTLFAGAFNHPMIDLRNLPRLTTPQVEALIQAQARLSQRLKGKSQIIADPTDNRLIKLMLDYTQRATATPQELTNLIKQTADMKQISRDSKNRNQTLEHISAGLARELVSRPTPTPTPAPTPTPTPTPAPTPAPDNFETMPEGERIANKAREAIERVKAHINELRDQQSMGLSEDEALEIDERILDAQLTLRKLEREELKARRAAAKEQAPKAQPIEPPKPEPVKVAPAPAPKPVKVAPAPEPVYAHAQNTRRIVDRALSSEPTGVDLNDARAVLPNIGDLKLMLSEKGRLKRAKMDLVREFNRPNFLGHFNPQNDIDRALDRYLNGPYVEIEQNRLRDIEKGFKIALRDARGEELEQVKEEIRRFWREWGGAYVRLHGELVTERTQGEALRKIRPLIQEGSLTPKINQMLDQLEDIIDQRPVTSHDPARWIFFQETNKATRDNPRQTFREHLAETAPEATTPAQEEAPKTPREQLIETAREATVPAPEPIQEQPTAPAPNQTSNPLVKVTREATRAHLIDILQMTRELDDAELNDSTYKGLAFLSEGMSAKRLADMPTAFSHWGFRQREAGEGARNNPWTKEFEKYMSRQGSRGIRANQTDISDFIRESLSIKRLADIKGKEAQIKEIAARFARDSFTEAARIAEAAAHRGKDQITKEAHETLDYLVGQLKDAKARLENPRRGAPDPAAVKEHQEVIQIALQAREHYSTRAAQIKAQAFSRSAFLEALKTSTNARTLVEGLPKGAPARRKVEELIQEAVQNELEQLINQYKQTDPAPLEPITDEAPAVKRLDQMIDQLAGIPSSAEERATAADLPPKGQRTAEDARRFFGSPKKRSLATGGAVKVFMRGNVVVRAYAKGGQRHFRANTPSGARTFSTLDQALEYAVNQADIQ